MRPLSVLALFLVLLTAAPALAEKDDLGYQEQTEGYGKLFAYVGGAVGAILVLLFGHYTIKQLIAEHQRGRKVAALEKILDDLPKPEDKDRYLGEKVPEWKVANRLTAMKAVLKYLARSDDVWVRKQLIVTAAEAFYAVKEAIAERHTEDVEDKLTDEYLEQLVGEIRKHKKDGVKRVFGKKLEVTSVEIVHVEVPAGRDKQSFTALVSARSKDYVENAKTKRLLRGDRKVYMYQEFWRFRRSKSDWLVERIRPSGDMDVVINAKCVLTHAELAKFSADADEAVLREFVGK